MIHTRPVLRNIVQAARKRGALVQFHAISAQGYFASTTGKSHQRPPSLRRLSILRPLNLHRTGGLCNVHSTSGNTDSDIFKGSHIPVICISEIPAPTLDYFLQCIEDHLEEEKKWLFSNVPSTLKDQVAFITSKDLEALPGGATRPATAFTSPFLGESIKQLADWFVANIRYFEGFTAYSFLVLDSRTVKDNTCLLVSTLDDELRTLRCDFKTCRYEIYSVEFGTEPFLDGVRDLFVKTGEVMTKEKFELVCENRLYVEDGQLKTKEKKEEKEEKEELR